MDVFVLPVFNIDGYDYTHKSVCYNFKPNFNLMETILCCYLKEFVDLLNPCLTCVFYPLGNFRTGCGGKLAPGNLDPAALELIPTGTSTLAGAVSATYGYILKGYSSDLTLQFHKVGEACERAL